MSKKKAILTTLGAVGAIAATGGLASIGVPGLIGGGSAAAAGTGMTLGEKMILGSALAQAGTGLYGAKTQADAARRTGETQTAAANDALAWQKSQLAKAQTDYDAWLHGGSVAKMGALLQLPSGSTPGPTPGTFSPGGSQVFNERPTAPPMPSAGAGQTPAAAAASGPMVRLVAPDGSEVRQFPANDPKVQGHLQRGWKQA